MQVFYVEEIKENSILTLEEQESKHLIRVLRKKIGDEVILVNGKGTKAEASIVGDHVKRAELRVEKVNTKHEVKNGNIHIAIAPTKNMDRYEWFLEKATEIGITEITPLLTSNSERKVIKEERLHKILVSAMKQSGRSLLPKLNPLVKIEAFLNEQKNSKCLIAHCEEEEKKSISTCLGIGEDVCVLIGPEGDFSNQEIDLAKKNGYLPISLGSTRLRTETAGLAACLEIVLLNR